MRLYTDKGKEGDANKAVIDLLGREPARCWRAGRLKHSYPHSWRSKAPLIFRNTPQWFISMGDDKGADGLRAIALKAIEETRFVPGHGRNADPRHDRDRPDWVISRQRAWGVPIAVFVNKANGEVLVDADVNARIFEAFVAEGADAWFADGAAARFLGNDHNPDEWEKVDDILDVWFESGSTHAFVLEQRDDLEWPASLYLEGTDQHRGWFRSSLLEACGTRGRAPFDAVLTHGFILDEKAQKMSKSSGNALSPQDVTKQYGADILRLWVVGTDYTEDPVFGPETVKQMADIYRRLRNTLRYLLGSLDGFGEAERVDPADMPELERWVLHRIYEMDRRLRTASDGFEFHPFFAALHNFCAVDLSAFYFDIRKDTLYCDPADDATRRAARTVLDILFDHLTAWLAPFLAFTPMRPGSAASARMPASRQASTCELSRRCRRLGATTRWRRNGPRFARSAVSSRARWSWSAPRNASAPACRPRPQVFAPSALVDAVAGLDFAEICITSDITIATEAPPAGAFTLDDVAEVGVVPATAKGEKCARCWRVLPEVGQDTSAPELCGRCAAAVSGFEPVAADA